MFSWVCCSAPILIFNFFNKILLRCYSISIVWGKTAVDCALKFGDEWNDGENLNLLTFSPLNTRPAAAVLNRWRNHQWFLNKRALVQMSYLQLKVLSGHIKQKRISMDWSKHFRQNSIHIRISLQKWNTHTHLTGEKNTTKTSIDKDFKGDLYLVVIAKRNSKCVGDNEEVKKATRKRVQELNTN